MDKKFHRWSRIVGVKASLQILGTCPKLPYGIQQPGP
jgi:hypothetical protein